VNENLIIDGSTIGTTLISKSTLYSTEIERELNEIEKDWKNKIKLVEAEAKKNPIIDKSILVKSRVSEHVNNDDFSRANEDENFIKPELNRILTKVSNDHISDYLLASIFKNTNIEEKFKDKTKLLEYLIRRIDELLTAEAKFYIKNENNEFEKVQRERERVEFNERYLNYRSKSEFDNLDSDDDDEQTVENESKKPLPEFEKLKEEAKIQQLKIKEFFKPSFEDDDAKSNDNPIILPDIDSLSQKQIRQKIFFEKFYKNVESLLKFSSFSNNFELKNHAKNFTHVLNLTNENTMFKTNEIPIVSIIMLEMLSVKLKHLNDILNEDKFIKTILNSLNLDFSELKTISKFLIYKN
jgi:hypothetical protein